MSKNDVFIFVLMLERNEKKISVMSKFMNSVDILRRKRIVFREMKRLTPTYETRASLKKLQKLGVIDQTQRSESGRAGGDL